MSAWVRIGERVGCGWAYQASLSYGAAADWWAGTLLVQRGCLLVWA